MKDLVQNLVEALREELKEYGEMLALLEQQQQMVMNRQAQDLLICVNAITAQAETITAARREREQHQRHAALGAGLAADAAFSELIPCMPPEYQPLVKALVEENNELLIRVQQRARQNHLLLNRAVDLMQRFLNSLFPGSQPARYDGAGQVFTAGSSQRSLYDYIG